MSIQIVASPIKIGCGSVGSDYVSKNVLTALMPQLCGIELYNASTSMLHNNVSPSKDTTSNLRRRSVVSRRYKGKLVTNGQSIWSR